MVFGGELKRLDSVEFKDLDKLDIVGVYPNYATAHAAWKAQAQKTVDNAHDAVFHRPHAPPARSRDRHDATASRKRDRVADAVVEAFGKQRWVQVTAGTLAAEYLRLVFKTTRFVIDPPDGYARIDAELPVDCHDVARPAFHGAVHAARRAIAAKC